MFPLAWADKKPKHIIFNAETTLAGKDSIRKRHRKEIEKGCFVTIAYEKHVETSMIISGRDHYNLAYTLLVAGDHRCPSSIQA